MHRLAKKGRASAIMGNHEYNLVAWWMKLPRYEEPKDSNRRTTEDVGDQRARWDSSATLSLPLYQQNPILSGWRQSHRR